MGVAAGSKGQMAGMLLVSILSSLRLTVGAVIVANGYDILCLWEGNIFHSHQNLNQDNPFKKQMRQLRIERLVSLSHTAHSQTVTVTDTRTEVFS